MTLSEAIQHCEEQAELLEDSARGCDMTDKVEREIACKSGKCAEEHRQLAEWLKDYKRMRENWTQLKETITDIKDNNEFDHDDVTLTCGFLLNYMGVLESEGEK